MHEYRWGDAPIQTAALLMFAEKPSVRSLRSGALAASLAAWRSPRPARRPPRSALTLVAVKSTWPSTWPSPLTLLPPSLPRPLPRGQVYVAVDYSHISTENEITSNTSAGVGAEGQYKKPKNLPQPKHSYARLEKLFQGCWSACAVANYFGLPGAPFVDEPNATRAMKRGLHERHQQASPAAHHIIDMMEPNALAEVWQYDVERATAPLPPEGLNGRMRRGAIAASVTAWNASLAAEVLSGVNKSDTDLIFALISGNRCCRCWIPPDELSNAWGHVVVRGVPLDLTTYVAMSQESGVNGGLGAWGGLLSAGRAAPAPARSESLNWGGGKAAAPARQIQNGAAGSALLGAAINPHRAAQRSWNGMR